jgi:glycosyltransferase involved in cell wall biosynthesis
MRVFASVGPGHHGETILAALRAYGIAYRAVLQWPELAVEEWRAAAALRRSMRWYSRQRRWMWALWRRLPWLSRYETPRVVDAWRFDRAASRELERCDLCIGWTQVSLQTLRHAVRLGVPTLLEHPMVHVASWQRLMTEEIARSGDHRGGYFAQFPDALVARMNAEYQVAQHISVLSSFARSSFLAEGVDPGLVLTVPLGVDTQAFSPGPPPGGPFRVLYVGRLEILKGVQYLLDAFARLPKEAELSLVGAVMPEMKPLLARQPNPRWRTRPPVARAELPRIYREADVVVFPTVNDAFGLVILEAMACGVPVIATEHSGARDIITDGVDGFIVPARDPAAIAERLEVLLADRGRARRMGEAARVTVLARYTEAHYAERLVSALKAAAIQR